MNIEVRCDKYKGKTILRFEDEHGNELSNLNMVTGLTIVFVDMEKIQMRQDWRGNECYFSQAES